MNPSVISDEWSKKVEKLRRTYDEKPTDVLEVKNENIFMDHVAESAEETEETVLNDGVEPVLEDGEETVVHNATECGFVRL